MSRRFQGGIVAASYDGLKAPNAPTIGTAAAGGGQVAVSFTAPSNVGGSNVSSYAVLASPGGFGASGTSSPVTVTGLTNGTTYTFSVAAINSYGFSPYSGTVTATPFLPVEDVFSTFVYSGNSSVLPVNNGIDLAGQGGMVWFKERGQAYDSRVFDTNRSTASGDPRLTTNNTDAQQGATTNYLDYNSNGFTLTQAIGGMNVTGGTYASWTFRKAPKFFDVVTWTGDGTFKRVLNHSLGVAPGFIVVKRTDTTSNWWTYHRGVAGSINGYLNLTNGFTNTGYVEPGSTLFGENPAAVFDVFNAGSGDDLNVNGGTYVAYLFAHDATANGFIQCGSYTGNGSATGPTVTLGWEPQYLMIKNASGTGNWQIVDNMRGTPVGAADATLQANLSNAESSVDYVSPAATGFQIASSNAEVNTNASTYIYIAIRRGPMKTPTVGTSVFSPIAYSGTGSPQLLSAGFPMDVFLDIGRDSTAGTTLSGYQWPLFTRLLGNANALETTNSDPWAGGWGDSYLRFDNNLGTQLTTSSSYMNFSGATYISYQFRRAPGFFDVVCYTGNAVNGRTVNHNLGVTPELMIMKNRSSAGYSWFTWDKSANLSQANPLLAINVANGRPAFSSGNLNSTVPTSTVFTVGGDSNVSGQNYITYLFASCPGVSKVGSYTGNGSSQTLNCGFTTGARFFLVKRTDASGNWWVYDSARGITAPADPAVALNSTNAEVTSADATDPDNSGIIVNQEATCNINVNGATYIFLAIS